MSHYIAYATYMGACGFGQFTGKIINENTRKLREGTQKRKQKRKNHERQVNNI